MTEKEFWTVQQTANFLGISPQAIRKALKEKRLEGKKFGHIWRIEAELIKNAVGEGHLVRSNEVRSSGVSHR